MPNTREKLEVIAHLGDHISYKEDIGICYDSELAKVIEDAYMALKNGVTVQEWIPANEPPKDNTENQWVIYKVGGSYFYSTGYYDGKCWRSAITDNRIQIAGWMPLPQPPKGE